MKVIKGVNEITREFRDSIVTIGNFDGIHLAHQNIFKRVITEAHNENRKSVVITFDPHPKKVIHPERRPFFLITSLDEKLKLIGDQGIDAVLLIGFSLEFAKVTAEEFVKNILWDKLHIKKIFIGHDYTFGRDKGGNEEYLKTLGKKLGFQVDVINAIKVNDTTISSTRTRNAILDGNVKLAAKFLGRPYNLGGTIVKGHQRGTGIGFPTANIKPEKVLVPGRGVYAIIAEIEGKIHPAVLNIGFNPTFANDRLSIEAHIIDFKGNICGKSLIISFIDRIRDEMKFEGPEKLAEQIKKDVAKARKILGPHF
ncbi:MAG: bifunctional riboflavin kinase/FAD synthetase [Thermodesulfobacteriota bacterium]|nr:bifunctional riboflavin kinase/FAD synthetase [Thermodesulfobacteriota bacterium]